MNTNMNISMNPDYLKEQLTTLIRDKFGIQIETLEEHLRLKEDLRMDSIMIVKLIVFIELDLMLQVPDQSIDPRAFSTVRTLLDFMLSLEPLSEQNDPVEMEVEAGEAR
ncbi:acyl carrier protein [Fontibacillus solani]|uniref:Acyl carrier protein n=1 Tax=Fontibacillus solani TaxID=1572857 RepID=A0A7W3SXW1_9BACL|nr:phosphopantetheine-binding protein [Fontibacillus solani]MBA9088242.1 acyl carrier protein [Fontibacillus solani]